MRKNHSLIVYGMATICCLGGLILIGCQGQEGTSPSTAAGAPRPDQAKEFLETLKGMPADQRQAYAAQHQDLVNGVNRSGDPKLRSEFMQLMSGAAQQK